MDLQDYRKEIDRIETQLQALDEEAGLYATDYQKLMELDARKEELNAALMELYERWEVLSNG